MQYVSYDELLTKIGAHRMAHLTDLAQGETADPNVANRALIAATVRVEGYLNRYELPLAHVPETLKPYVIDIAIWELCKADDGLMTDTVSDAYAEAIDFLKRVSDGKANLGKDEPPLKTVAGTTGEGAVLFTEPAQLVFSRENMKDM